MARGFLTTMTTLLLFLILLQAVSSINQDTSTEVEKEVLKLHDHVLPGLSEAADQLVGIQTYSSSYEL